MSGLVKIRPMQKTARQGKTSSAGGRSAESEYTRPSRFPPATTKKNKSQRAKSDRRAFGSRVGRARPSLAVADSTRGTKKS
jgi:hypothetical protein